MMRRKNAGRLKVVLALKINELFGIDLRSLAVFRMALALLILWDLVSRSRDLTAHYTDRGVLPRAALISQFSNPWHLSLHLLNGTAPVQAALFLIAGLCAVTLLVGYRTRLCTWLSWALLVSLHNRNSMVLHGSDVLLRMMLFWALFLPLGACCSLDSLAHVSSPKPCHRAISMGTAAYLLQIVFVYWFNALNKTGVEWRTEGSAVYYALSIDQLATSIGHWLLQFPELLKGLTFATWWCEALGPFLLFVPIWTGPIRTAAIVGFWCLHVGFGVCLELGPFPWVSACTLLPFVPTWYWERSFMRRTLTRLGTLCEQAVVKRNLTTWFRSDEARRIVARRSSWLANSLAGCFLGYVLLWNLSTVKQFNYRMPQQIAWVGPLLRLDQMWNMFAPYPLKEDGWFVIPATLANSTHIDLIRGMAPVSWEKARGAVSLYNNYRWKKYLAHIWDKKYREHRRYFARYLCLSWNARHAGPTQLESFEIVYMLENTLPNYQPPEIQKVVLTQWFCSDRAKPQ